MGMFISELKRTSKLKVLDLSYTILPNTDVSVLTGGPFSITENSASDVLIGSFVGKKQNSTLTLVDDLGGRIKIIGTGLFTAGTGFDFEAGNTYSFEVIERINERDYTRNFSLSVLNAYEQPTLTTLTLSQNTIQAGISSTINILGTKTGSTLVGTVPAGMVLNSAARTITGIPSVANSNFVWTITETLADSVNSPKTSTGSINITPVVESLIVYGRTENYDAGTSGDYFVSTSGLDTNLGTFGQPYRTIQKAVDQANAAGGNKTIRIRGGVYREFIQGISMASGIRIKPYGTEKVYVTGAELITGWTAATSAQSAILGGGYASVYYKDIPKSSIETTGYHSLLMTENGELLDLVQDRADLTDLFTQDDYNKFYTSNSHPGMILTLGSGGENVISLSHPMIFSNYSDAQLAAMSVVFHTTSNLIRVLPVASASNGVMYFDTNTVKPITTGSPSTGYKYALLNPLKNLQEGQWGFQQLNSTTLRLFVKPNNASSLNTGMEIAARAKVMRFVNSNNLIIDGLYFTMTASDANSAASMIELNGCDYATLTECSFKNWAHSERGNGAVYTILCDDLNVSRISIENGQNTRGLYLSGAEPNYIYNLRCDRVYIKRTTQTPINLFGSRDCIISYPKLENCGSGAHANLMVTGYLGCDQVVVFAPLVINPYKGYMTWAETSNLTIIHAFVPQQFDGRGMYDQNGGDGQEPPIYPSNNFIFNSFVAYVPSASTGYAPMAVGDDQWQVNFGVINSVTPELELRGGEWVIRKSNIQLRGSTYDPTEVIVSQPEKLFGNASAGDWTAIAGSEIYTTPATSVESYIVALEERFPDFNFRRDILGRQWNPTDPGIGPWGKQWPGYIDQVAPTTPAPAVTIAGANAAVKLQPSEPVTIHWAEVSGSVPTKDALISGTGFLKSGNRYCSDTREQTFNVSGTSGTTPKFCFVMVDRSGNPGQVTSVNLPFIPYSAQWQVADGVKSLIRTDPLIDANSVMENMVIAISHMRPSSVFSASQGSAILTTQPSGGSHTIDATSSGRMRFKLRSADNVTSNYLDFTSTLNIAADIKYVTLVTVRKIGTSNYTFGMRTIRVSDGVNIGGPTIITGKTQGLRGFDNTSLMQLLNFPSTLAGSQTERIQIWDDVGGDVDNLAFQELFVKNGALVDPSVSVNSLGEPLVNLFGPHLSTGNNFTTRGGDFKYQ